VHAGSELERVDEQGSCVGYHTSADRCFRFEDKGIHYQQVSVVRRRLHVGQGDTAVALTPNRVMYVCECCVTH
jgi:hypothetical protein